MEQSEVQGLEGVCEHGTPEEFLRTEFLDRLAHELRGPAGVILGGLDELEYALGEMADGERALLAVLRRGALKVLRTADRLTRASQLESGVSFVKAPVDLRDVVRRACCEAQRLEQRSTVRLDLRLPELPCHLPLDEEWTHAALAELIGQALSRARQEVSVQILDGQRVQIANDGLLLRRPSRRRFEPHPDRRDSGLGMPLAYDVAEKHGGALHIESGERDVRFTLELPAS